MKQAKRDAIIRKLDCHRGEATIAAVFNYLPDSCEDLPRAQIVDILNAINAAFQAGKKAEAEECKEAMGANWYEK